MTGIERRPGGRSGSGWAITWGIAGQAVMLAGIAAAVGLSHASHVPAPVSAWSVPAGPGAFVKAPPYAGADMIAVVVATDGQAAKDAYPYDVPGADFTVLPGADLTFTVTMVVPAGDDVTDASLLAAPGSLNSWGFDGSLPVGTSQPITAGTLNTFTVRWDESAQDLVPGSQWTLVLATAGPDTSAQAPIAEITIIG